MAKLIDYIRSGKIDTRQYRAMVNREHRKLIVEVQRCKGHKRPHVPLFHQLMYARWKRKGDAKTRRKGFRKS